MIPVLKDKLWSIYNTDFCVEEFQCGNGIADLVLCKNWSFENSFLDIEEYDLVDYLVKNLTKINKKLKIEEVLWSMWFKNKKIKLIVDKLLEKEYIWLVDDNFIVVKKSLKPFTKKIIAIEAKLKDRKSWLAQAMRYKIFAHESHLAISSEYIHRVDIELFKEYNIWLISVSNDNIKIIYKPRSYQPKNKTTYYFLSSNLVRNYTYETN